MVVRKAAALAALTAIGVLALDSTSASATTALRTDPSGALLSGATVRNIASDPFLLVHQSGSLTCSQAFMDLDVNSNTSATSITGKLTTMTFTSCSDTILAVNIVDCTLVAGRCLR
jgi:hypothetical protein